MSEKKAAVKSFFVALAWVIVTFGIIFLVNWGFAVNELVTASIILFMMIFGIAWLLLFVHYATK
jgi:hypothetical protein